MDIFAIIVQSLTAAAIIFAAWQLLLHSRQMHREFELIYVQRYWQIMDRRTHSFALAQEAEDSDRLVIRSYLQLSEDEADLRSLGRITDNTWKFWASAIVEQASSGSYQAELDRVEINMYPRVRDLLAGRAEPLSHGWLQRKFRGL